MPGPEKFNQSPSPEESAEEKINSKDIIETEAEYRTRLKREKTEARMREIEDSSKRREEQRQKIKAPDKPPESKPSALARRPVRVVPRKKKIGPQLRRPIIKKDQIEMVEPVIIEVDRNSAKDKKGK